MGVLLAAATVVGSRKYASVDNLFLSTIAVRVVSLNSRSPVGESLQVFVSKLAGSVSPPCDAFVDLSMIALSD
jgi:hypothetical protein